MQTSQGTSYSESRSGMVSSVPSESSYCSPGRIAEVAIEAGYFATKGTSAANQCKLPTSAAEVTTSGLGFAAWSSSRGTNDSGAEYAVGADVVLLEKGRIWVTTSQQMAVDDPVFVVHASTGRGTVRKDADTANAAQVFGAKVTKVASSTLCEIQLPVPPGSDFS